MTTKSRLLSAAALMVTTFVAAIPASACSQYPNIGSICFTAAAYCPDGYLPLNGVNLPVADYQPLYSLLGNAFGGHGYTDFNLPDMRGRSPVGVGVAPPNTGPLYPVTLGLQRGTETHTLTTSEMPAHTHVAAFEGIPGPLTATAEFKASTVEGTSNVPSAATPYLAAVAGGGTIYVTNPGTAITPAKGASVALSPGSGGAGAVTNANTGQSQPFNLRPPQTVLTACIANRGVYPPRP